MNHKEIRKGMGYNKIGVANFGIFENMIDFDISPITVFTGPNSSGKSTLNKLIQILSHAFKFKWAEHSGGMYLDEIEKITLNLNEVEEFGSLYDCLNINKKQNTLDLKFTFDTRKKNRLSFPTFSYTLSDVTISYSLKYRVYNDGRVNNGTVWMLEYFEILIEDEVFISFSKREILEYLKEDKILVHDEIQGREYVSISENKKGKPLKHWVLNKSRINPHVGLDLYFNILESLNDRIAYPLGYGFIVDENTGEFYKNQPDPVELYDGLYYRNFPFFKEEIGIKLKSNLALNIIHEDINSTNKSGNSILPISVNDKKVFFDSYKSFEQNFLEKLFITFYNKTIEVNSYTLKELGKKYDIQYLNLDYSENYKVLKGNSFNNIFSQRKAKVGITIDEVQDIITDIDNPISDLLREELNNKGLFNIDYVNEVAGTIHENIVYDLVNFLKGKIVEDFNRNEKVFRNTETLPEYFLYSNSYGDLEYLKKLGDSVLNKNNFRTKDQIQFINKWIKDFKIGEELLVSPINSNTVNIGFELLLKSKNGTRPLFKEGFGVRKLVALICYLNPTKNRADAPTYLLEEPEANLHPAFQSKLAELFAEVSFSNRIIVETHSEYIIRKLQNVVADSKNEISNEDVSIYYLHNPEYVPEGEKQVYKLDIREDGFLNNDFGKGFYDEASNLSLGLLNLKDFN